jgi:glycosyltransferase involved in cell wall biosynthesis
MACVPIVTYTSLFPNREMPHHGVFVAERLRRLLATRRVSATVVAPLPWFPSKAPLFGEYGRYARVPGAERWEDSDVLHPRYGTVPGIGMNIQAFSLARATLRELQRLKERGLAAVIDAHYFYPDGVAAAWLGQRLRIPVVITARGSDINVLARHSVPRRLILRAAQQAAAVVTVSESLRAELIRMGVPADRVQTLRNGVDLVRFSPPADRAAVRESLGLNALTLLSVGRLVPGKGHALVVRALQQIPDAELVVVGDGPERSAIEEAVKAGGLSGRVRFTGALPHAKLVEYYRAADVMVLASASEGMPNVVLEALACGMPVVATAVGGIPEILDRGVGRVVAGREPPQIAAAINELCASMPERAAVRGYAERFGWDDTIGSLANLIEGLAANSIENERLAAARH